MKKLFLMAALATGIMTVSMTVMADNHMKTDTDGDGMISKAEFMAKHEEMFAKIDTDGDGMLSKEERKDARERSKQKMKDKMQERMDKMKEKMDESSSY